MPACAAHRHSGELAPITAELALLVLMGVLPTGLLFGLEALGGSTSYGICRVLQCFELMIGLK